MSSTYMRLDGLKDCQNWTMIAPDNLNKLMFRAMIHAGSREASRIKGQIYPDWRELVAFNVTKKGFMGRYLNLGIGMFNKKVDPFRPKAVPDWYKAYWKNYGTLERRDPQHHFKNGIKPDTNAAARRRRNNKGQPATHFFEIATRGWAIRLYNDIDKVVTQDIDMMYDR